MSDQATLHATLDAWARGDARRRAVAETVEALAQAGVALSDMIGLGRLAGDLNAEIGANADSDLQRLLDVRANEIVLDALRRAPVALCASEEMDEAIPLDPSAPLAVAIDPLDGSSNIETTAPIGTIFSILPRPEGDVSTFTQPGSAQLAAGFLLYGSSTALALTLGEGTQIYTLDRRRGELVLTDPSVAVPQNCREYAINGSNYRFWDEPVRAFVDDCLAGRDGPMGVDHNTRWLASLVAEAFRILRRGGVYLYPGDSRASTRNGRLRLVYEANPIAFLVEQAGGAATNGVQRILDLTPDALHGRVPLVFGSRDQVERVARYHTESAAIADRSPLFNRRSLLRA